LNFPFLARLQCGQNWKMPGLRLNWKTLAFASFLAFNAAVADAAHSTKNVLLVFDEDNDLTGLSIINRNVREVITSELDGEVEFYSESLNLSQFTRPDHDIVMLDYLQRKYAEQRLDLIVAVLTPTLDFLLRHRESLFPTVPIVFCGVDSSELTRKMVRRDVAGVLLRRTYAPSVEAALSVQPRTRHVYVVGGSSVFDLKAQTIARRDLAALSNRVPISYLTGLPMRDLLKTVSTLPPESVILYLTIFADGTGRTFVPHDALSLIAKAANAPTYVAVDQYVGRGAVGGYVYDTATHARYAGRLGARVLKGEAAADIAVTEAADHTHLFDWRQLERWGIDERRLPSGRVIAFRRPSVWDRYKWYVTAGITLILLQSALIAGLLVNRAQRRRAEIAARESELRRARAEEELRQQRDDLAHALRVTALGELAASFAHEVGQPLTAILANAQAARRLRMADVSDPEIDSALAEIADGVKEAGETIRRLRTLVKKGHTERTKVDLNKLVDEVLRLLRTDLMQKGIAAAFIRGENLPAVYGDPVQLRQVLMNLLVNAEDAIASAEDGPREIDIATNLTDRGLIAMSVRDSGVGVDESDLERMFQHFVTTKPHGLGMGLAISRSIVAAHGGRIWASRNELRGLTLHVELPAAPTHAA
jgi:signal transduction histidine kinase